MSTVGELITEKKNNFCNFLLTIIEDEEIKSKVNEENVNKYKENVQRLRDTTIEIFIFWVSNDLCRKKDKLDTYPTHFLKLNGIEYIPEIDKYKEKIIAYLKLFIDLLEYTFQEDDN